MQSCQLRRRYSLTLLHRQCTVILVSGNMIIQQLPHAGHERPRFHFTRPRPFNLNGPLLKPGSLCKTGVMGTGLAGKCCTTCHRARTKPKFYRTR